MVCYFTRHHLIGNQINTAQVAALICQLGNFFKYTAADIIKIAMVRVYRRLQAEGLRARLILQIHDELMVEAPPEEAERAAALLKEEMEAAASLRVKLEVDVHCGRTWYDAKG